MRWCTGQSFYAFLFNLLEAISYFLNFLLIQLLCSVVTVWVIIIATVIDIFQSHAYIANGMVPVLFKNSQSLFNPQGKKKIKKDPPSLSPLLF